jgi:hypothetical protein
MAEAWAEAMLAELGLRRAAGGDRPEDMVRLFATAYYRYSPEPPVGPDGISPWQDEADRIIFRRRGRVQGRR